jgi:hypothetical protein
MHAQRHTEAVPSLSPPLHMLKLLLRANLGSVRLEWFALNLSTKPLTIGALSATSKCVCTGGPPNNEALQLNYDRVPGFPTISCARVPDDLVCPGSRRSSTPHY